MRRGLPRGFPLASHLALSLALMLFGAALWSALRIEPLPPIAPATPGGTLTLAGASRDPMPVAAASSRALASDPFSPARRLRVEAAGTKPVSRAATPGVQPVPVRLLGTVVRGDGGFAVCQIASDPPRTVRVGETLGELTLITLDRGRAIFRAANGSRVELSLTTPGT